MPVMKRVVILIAALLFPALQSAAEPKKVTVFAAASLGDVLQDIAQEYDGDVAFSFGGSGVMARQVAAGAPADLVILANPDWMQWLVSQGVVEPNTPIVVGRNALVVIGPKGSAPLEPSQILTRLAGNRLAMGQRDAVPAGKYAQAWLQSAGLWQALEMQLAETDNVRAALALVARGETPLGIVYATDAMAEPRVENVYNVPLDQHPPILYPAAPLTPAGADFLTNLTGDAAIAIFASHGFRSAHP